MNPLTYCKPIQCPRLEYLDQRIYQWYESGQLVNKGNGHWLCRWSDSLAVFIEHCPMIDLWKSKKEVNNHGSKDA